MQAAAALFACVQSPVRVLGAARAPAPHSYVVCINTIGNALFVDPEKECAVIAPKGGYGGLGGGYVKQTALANIRMISLKLAEHGRPDIDVIGAGGVASGTDAFEMILCGAKAVQVQGASGLLGHVWGVDAKLLGRIVRGHRRGLTLSPCWDPSGHARPVRLFPSLVL